LIEAAMQRSKPPFRADHVGSLLRPAALKAARAQRESGAITGAELRDIEDFQIERVIDR
jgi:5-methyltetrahydropteroyltriglutamate--homocysteine methyltransferase